VTKKEKQLRIFIFLSGLVYLGCGFFFAVAPVTTIGLFNRISNTILPSLPLTPAPTEKFWLALAFSMMMTIAALCFFAAYNIRRNKVLVVSLMVSKCASAVSSMVFFIFSARYLSYLGIFVVDGSIFWITLVFYLRAHREFFVEHTAYLRTKKVPPKSTGPARVVALSGDDKFALLDDVLEQAGFWSVLRTHFDNSGRSKEDYRVVIKPNFMYMHSKKDYSTYTDPELVEALVDKIAERGFTNITLVEAQSTLGNYYANREVVKVAEYIGYSTDKNYRIVDLTEEKVPYDYGGRLGKHFVGPTWRDADFRVSFAKNKTHVFSHYTLTLKNIYGTLPMQNKLKEYHTKREYDWPTIETLQHFPVHFGVIDGFTGADGDFGVIVDPTPVHTKTMIAGENLIAVDWVGAKKMGLDPDDPTIGRFLPLAVEAFGKPEVEWVGDKSLYDPWKNVSEVFIQSLDIIEEAYAFSDWWFSGLTAMDEYFKFKKKAWPIYLLRKILRPFKRLFFRYDYLE
jgi:uncharacterized protein (DUF362 family)